MRRTTSAALALLLALSVTATASAQSIPLIRDAETEALIADYTLPIFRAAGVASQNIKVHLINDQSFNAFVIDGRNMFINTGAIILSETPNQLIGVIAHETGHIKGGHNVALQRYMEKAQTAALFLQLLSIGAAVGGAASGSQSGTEAGTALLYGGQQVIIRNILSYRRAQEGTADRSAIDYLNKTGQSAEGMLKTFRYFADQSIGTANLVDPYIQTHPVPRDRIAQLEELVAQSKFRGVKDSPQLQLRHDLVRAKLSAYVYQNNPMRVLRQYSDNSLPSRYARAIVKYHSGGGYRAAAPLIDELIAAAPQNPWFYELKGTFLVESGNGKLAVEPFRKALALAPRSAFLKIELAQALLETNTADSAKHALDLLQSALISEDQSEIGYRMKAQALALLNRIPEADLASAQASFHRGDWKNARALAQRAQQQLAPNSPAWFAAEEIVNYRPDKLHG